MKTRRITMFNDAGCLSYYFEDYLIKKPLSVILISSNLGELRKVVESFGSNYLLKDDNNYYYSCKCNNSSIFVASVFQAEWLVINKNIDEIIVYKPEDFPYYVLDNIYGLVK